MIKKIKSHSDKNHRLCTLIVFFSSIGLAVLLSWLMTGKFVYYNGDSPMYISIADNFLDNGHFEQTHRETRDNFIVPFGYPAILTVIRFFTRSDIAISLVQYVVFAVSNTFLYCTERNFFGGIGGLAPLMNIAMIWRIHYAGPGCIVTETWYLAPVIFCIWLLSRRDISSEKRLTFAFIALCFGFIVRPVIGLALFPLAVYMLYLSIKKKYSLRRCYVMLCAFGAVMCAIGFVNLRSAEHFVMTEGYSGISVYLANNDTVAREGVDVTKGEYEYADDVFNKIYEDERLDYFEKNEQIGRLGREYIISHPLVTMRNIAVKFSYMFIEYWYGLAFIAAAGVYFACRYRKVFRREFLIITAFALLFALVTSAGLPEPRYMYIVFPFFTLFTSSAVCTVVHRFIPRLFSNTLRKKKD